MFTIIQGKKINNKINEIKTRREAEKLFESFDEIIPLNQIVGITLSFPSKINAEKGIVNKIATSDRICDMPLKTILEEKYKKPAWIENDGKCAALAELWKGNLSNVKNGVVIGLGTEIACGIIINGLPYRGSNETAGEFSSILTYLKTMITKIGSAKSQPAKINRSLRTITKKRHQKSNNQKQEKTKKIQHQL